MHEQMIVHRDLKLENMVFLHEVKETNALQESRAWNELEDVEIKIIDFGTATKIKYSKNTSKNRVVTTSYMAPEVLEGVFNEKCDIWSIGVILHILLTGSSPFKSKKSKEETYYNITHQKITCTGKK